MMPFIRFSKGRIKLFVILKFRDPVRMRWMRKAKQNASAIFTQFKMFYVSRRRYPSNV